MCFFGEGVLSWDGIAVKKIVSGFVQERWGEKRTYLQHNYLLVCSVRPIFLRRGINNPDLGCKRPFGNRLELRQIHVVDVHEPLSDFPFSVSRWVHVRTLEFDVRQRPSAILPRGQLTLIKSKYRLSFLATSCASLLRVIGSRPLFQ